MRQVTCNQLKIISEISCKIYKTRGPSLKTDSIRCIVSGSFPNGDNGHSQGYQGAVVFPLLWFFMVLVITSPVRVHIDFNFALYIYIFNSLLIKVK